MKKCLLIINPCSGKLKMQSELMDVIRILNENNYIVQVQISLTHNHVIELAKNAEDVDLIVCSGGDGTLNQVVSGLIKGNKNIPIGYIPSGSTNDYAVTLGLSFDIKTATQNIVSGNTYEFDVGKFDENNYFAYIASFGLFSSVSYTTPQALKNQLGSNAYLLNGISELLNAKQYHIKGKTENAKFEGDYILGLISNTLSVAGIMKLNPEEVDLSDGLFEILLIKQPKDLKDYNDLFNGIVNRNFNSPMFTFLKARTIELEFEEPMVWSLDGERTNSDKIVKIENLHKRIQIMK